MITLACFALLDDSLFTSKNCFENWLEMVSEVDLIQVKKSYFPSNSFKISIQSRIGGHNNKKCNFLSTIFLGPKRILCCAHKLSSFLKTLQHTTPARELLCQLLLSVPSRPRSNKAGVGWLWFIFEATTTTTIYWPNRWSIKHFLKPILCSRYKLNQWSKKEIRFSIKFRSLRCKQEHWKFR